MLTIADKEGEGGKANADNRWQRGEGVQRNTDNHWQGGWGSHLPGFHPFSMPLWTLIWVFVNKSNSSLMSLQYLNHQFAGG